MSANKSILEPRAIEKKSITRNRMETPGFVWLDSSLTNHPRSLSSYVFEKPLGEIRLQNGILSLVGEAARYRGFGSSIYDTLDAIYLDATFAAAGFISYEAMLEELGITTIHHPQIPAAHFYLYEKIESIDLDEVGFPCAQVGAANSKLRQQISRNEYGENIQAIKNHIHEGDIYQANFTSRFDISSRLPPSDVYLALRDSSPASHSAFLNYGDFQVLSSSPERMFRLDHNRIVTNPIKGTIRRTGNPADDNDLVEKLLNSSKNIAELLMIVDLERNDLGIIAEVGSVKVDALHKPEIYSSLIHLVAEVSAIVRQDFDLGDIFRALLPGGSITGAPKRRAIEIISALESCPRAIYTGCIGYLDGRACQAEFNIAIRTMTHYDDRYEIHAGGGIVADSTEDDEYDEMMLKASRMFSAVGLNDVGIPQ